MQNTNRVLIFLNVFDRLEKNPPIEERNLLIDALRYDMSYLMNHEVEEEYYKIIHKLEEIKKFPLSPAYVNQCRQEIIESLQIITRGY